MSFIALEGGEGVGKTTQLNLLQEQLPQLFPNREFVFTREPGGTEFGEAIRTVILSDLASAADGKTMFGLFMATRFDHVRRVIKPALDAGKVVITDRFVGSSFAYQVVAQDEPISEEFFDAHVRELGVFPDVTLVFDMDVSTSQERVRKRHSIDTANHFDDRAYAFHQKLRSGYERFLRKFDGCGAYRINAGQFQDDVHHSIMTILKPILSVA